MAQYAIIVMTKETHESEAFGPYLNVDKASQDQIKLEQEYDPEDYEFALVRLRKLNE